MTGVVAVILVLSFAAVSIPANASTVSTIRLAENFGISGNVSTLISTIPNSIQTGDLIIVNLIYYSPNSSGIQMANPQDTLGNSFSPMKSTMEISLSNYYFQSKWFIASSISSGPDQFTFGMASNVSTICASIYDLAGFQGYAASTNYGIGVYSTFTTGYYAVPSQGISLVGSVAAPTSASFNSGPSYTENNGAQGMCGGEYQISPNAYATNAPASIGNSGPIYYWFEEGISLSPVATSTSTTSTTSLTSTTSSSSTSTSTTSTSSTSMSSSSSTSTSTTTTITRQGPLYPLLQSPQIKTSPLYVVSDSSWGYSLTALQGLVARSSPQIFFAGNSMDNTYLNEIVNQLHVGMVSYSAQQALQKFVPQFVSQTNGKINIVIFDSKEPASDYYWETNTARTISGVTGALPVGSNQVSQFENWFPNVNVLYDLRSSSICNGCAETSAGAIAGYAWAWNTFGAQTTRTFTTISPNGRYQGGDYEVEFRSFVWSMCDPSVVPGCSFDSSQQAFAKTILSAYPRGAVAMGFFGLGGEACSTCTVNILSGDGFLQDNSELSPNLSMYSSLPSIQNSIQPHYVPISYNPNKVYVLWEYSQGDADSYEFYTIQKIYQEIDPATNAYYRDEIPISIQLKTIMAQTAPPVVQFYYSDQNSLGDFMTAPSGGAGYSHPEAMPQGTSTGSEYWYAQESKTLADNLGVSDIFVIWGSNGLTTSNIQTFINDWGSPKPGALFFWQNQGSAPKIINGVPVFYSTFWQPNCSYKGVGGGSACSVSSTVSEIHSSSGQWINIIMNTAFPGYAFIHDVMNSLGSNYVPVNARQYTCLYLQSQNLVCPAS